jgi:uncharacterized membrane protein YcaP (DUF421 family)
MNLQTLSALYVSPMVDLGRILSTKGRGWATDDAEIIITDGEVQEEGMSKEGL